MNNTVKLLLIGAAAGAAATLFVRSSAFRKGAAQLVAASIQLKKDASAFVESIKEDAEDAAAEAEYKDSKSKKGGA